MRVFISDMFSSVLVRLALIFGALALMTGAAIILAWMVFQSISTNMAAFSEVRIPALRDSSRVVSTVDRTRAMLTDILIARTEEDLQKLDMKKRLILEDLEESISHYTDEGASDLKSAAAGLQRMMTALTEARQAEFDNTETVAAYVKEAMELSAKASALLEEAADTAFFDLVLGGDATISEIDLTLTNLIERDFAQYQAALELRAEINLLSGLALSAAQTRDPSMISILNDVASASNDRLTKLQSALAEQPPSSDLSATIETARSGFMRSFGESQDRLTFSDILSLRQSVDAELSSALDDIYFELVITGDDAKSQNEATIRQLLDVEVTSIRQKATLGAAARSYFSDVLQVALARNPVELKLRADTLALAETHLISAIGGAPESIKKTLTDMLKFSDPETGIVATRAGAFEAQESAVLVTQIATDSVRQIAGIISTYASDARNGIEVSSNLLQAEVLQARDLIQQLGLASALLVLAAPVFIWLMVTRPLNRVTALTERLATGDLSEFDGKIAQSGEIGRLFKALKVFREGALERIRMQQEEKARDARMQEAERAAENQRRELEIKERETAALLEKKEREREAHDLAREEEARKRTEAERKARLDEQAAVVAALARSLKGLSNGDLTHYIEEAFPESYEALRQDYNAAIENLAELIQKIGTSSGKIDESSTEIAASSLDLSRRTENTAATLEETAAALSQLTVSVASAARGASNASATVDTVKLDAEKSTEVMLQAVTAMSQIENSSSEIAKIVEVIDAISFQTNLLALNAGVEAARAGDEGRGFAVVASEVRQLAHRCADAALQISSLISDSSEHVQKGVKLIDQTNEALDVILKGISNVAQNVSEIAMASTEQSGGIAEINVAIEQLDRSTQRNAAMFEETTAASQVLTGEASQLTTLVAGFKVNRAASANVLKEPQDIDIARFA